VGKIMNDAVEQDFFFLNFAEEFFMIKDGIACRLQDLSPLVILGVEGADGKDGTFLQEKCHGAQRDFCTGSRDLDPGPRVENA
jgi:hypothetical protein